MTDLWPHLPMFLALLIPVALLWAAVCGRAEAPFARVGAAAWMAVGLAGVTAMATAMASAMGSGSAGGGGLGRWLRVDGLTVVMLLLVCTLALVIVRYSRSYLRGAAGQLRYARALAATLGSVTTLVIANDLLLIAVAWVGTSVALHQLLTFFGGRRAALVAAHKKFIVSRLAEVCVLTALGLIWGAVGSLELDAVEAWAQQHAQLSPGVQAAALLLVMAVALKSAQLPFHGWLTQVMEAPTPVSALLHAGVVNIGGFVMIRLAPLMMQAPVARTLLVVVGTVTVVVAGLVGRTRVSVKVALAWSTCAQMGFMLVECGLGAWSLALLHLVAHSLYKAHAFLSAGSAVDAWRSKQMAGRMAAPSMRAVGLAAVVTTSASVGVGALTTAMLGAQGSTPLPLLVAVGLGLAPLLASAGRLTGEGRRELSLAAGGVLILYTGGHLLAGWLLAYEGRAVSDVGAMNAMIETLGWGFALAGFVGLFGLQLAMQGRPEGRVARVMGPRLRAGLYLDEVFTRVTFWIWPPRLPAERRPERRQTVSNAVEVCAS